MRFSVRKLLAAGLVLCGAIWPAAPATAAEPVGVFLRVEGNVDVLHLSDTAAVPVRAGDPVFMSDAVRTKRDGKAEIQFKDETALQLAPETRILIDEYTYQGNTRQRGFLSLLRGKVRAIVSKVKAAVIPVAQSDSNFMIKTPTAIAGVKGTDLIVSFDRGITAVFFLDGNGFVFNPSLPKLVIPIRRGQGTFVMGGDRAPLSARNLPAAFVAPYVKETGSSGTSGGTGQGDGGTPGTGGGTPSEPSEGGGGTTQSATNVVLENTGFTVLIDPETVLVESGPFTVTLPLPGPDPTGSGTPSGTGGGDTVQIPFTESHPEALNLTNVTVNVRIP